MSVVGLRTINGRIVYGGTPAEAFSTLVDAHFTRTRNGPPAIAVAEAVKTAMNSPCRSKRGAAIFHIFGGRPFVTATGFNNKPSPFTCDGSDQCKADCRNQAVHAEQRALLNERYRCFVNSGTEMVHVKVVNGDFVASGGPSCVQCSKLILASGLSAMWLFHADGWRRYQADEFHWLSMQARKEGTHG